MTDLTDIEFYIKKLEIDGEIHPDCMTCKNIFYPQLKVGIKFSDIFAPRHKPSKRCESGKFPHCTCDTCF